MSQAAQPGKGLRGSIRGGRLHLILRYYAAPLVWPDLGGQERSDPSCQGRLMELLCAERQDS